MRASIITFLLYLAVIGASAQQRTPAEQAAELRRIANELDPPSIVVADSAGLTAALNTAPAGGQIELRPGTYTGNFVVARSLTLTGVSGAQLVTPNNQPALHVTADDVTITGIAATGPADDLVILSGARNVLSASTLTGTGHTKRGVRLEGPHQAVVRSVITNIYRVGQDSQCIAGWDTPGPILIEDNVLECASENILFGGADPIVPGTIPSDLIIRGNTLTKQLAWAGQGLNVKNGLELKSARRVTITGNTIEHIPKDAQAGWCFVFTPVNQDGQHPAADVSDVLVEDNVCRDVAASMQLARGGYVLARITVRRNLFDATGVSSARNILILGGPSDLVVESNTFRYARTSGASTIYGYDGPVSGFRFTGNLVRVAGEYGICTQGNCNGRLWQQFFPGGVIEGNAIEGFPSPANVPGNLFLAAGDPDPVGYGR